MKAGSVFILVLLLAAGCASESRRTASPTVARFYLEGSGEATSRVVLPRSEVELAVMPKPVISEFDQVNVEIVEVELGRCLMFQLTAAASRDLHRLTASRQGRRLVLMVNERPLGARRIEAPLTDGALMIFLEIPDSELPALVRDLRGTMAAVRGAGKS